MKPEKIESATPEHKGPEARKKEAELIERRREILKKLTNEEQAELVMIDAELDELEK